MRLFLAGLEGTGHYTECKDFLDSHVDNFFWLSSYYYARKDKFVLERLPNFNIENFLLDSGAFTFMSKGLNEDIDKYTSEYIEFINKYNIKYFFEMDVDTILGYDKVKELRKTIEKGTGKKCIPVWHKERGIEEFKKHCEEYDYIAIGGLVGGKVNKIKKILISLIKYANSKNVKIHLLGYNKNDILDYKAFSCDATSWNGGMYGGLWNWSQDKEYPVKTNRSLERRVSSEKQRELYLHNLKVWEHYQQILKYKGYWREQ